ncbi:MAG: UDP-3-O-acyl-N-acetylglucosamine deacetylase [Phycisphaerae bacterium]|nr:UDP-3-O-[3-hydroxymyristoyl] N-acetylglucosamine deacetylase [Phycisphaerae bacterium]MCZ2398999.1 UDP-3-O-acyl-N-acetylglucosamine deacetylase [Phycisphaerae bacterium]NUQ50437.1 UDP-3-O-[3-hydroxymyristoyl] N-acetylglucosamine deacetylase [Phycisphaerae bacterium]
MSRQQTIENEARLSGRGLFTGAAVNVRFLPAPPGSGVLFVRSDQAKPVRIPARLDNLTKRARRTSLRNGTVAIETVEHCLAAIRGLSIDNLVVELDNTELPATDGSSLPFVEALRSAGIAPQEAERDTLVIRETLRVCEGDAELVAWPGDESRLEIIYELDYGADSPVGRQIQRFTLDDDDFAAQLAPARTFVTEEEAAQLRAAGLGQHLTYRDILVIGRDGPIDNALRFPDECVRHKILDLVGDLMLVGSFVAGRVYARKSGHNLNHELVRKLLEQRQAEHLGRLLTSRSKLDIRQIQRILPHRYPMLLVDRVIEMQADRRAVGVKNVTINEAFFQGHYPRTPIMPGVLLIEAMAQLGGVLLSQKLEHTGKVAVLLSLDKVKFRRAVVPGDQVLIEATARRVKSRTGEVFCRATVGEELAAEAMIRFMMVDADPLDG